MQISLLLDVYAHVYVKEGGQDLRLDGCSLE